MKRIFFLVLLLTLAFLPTGSHADMRRAQIGGTVDADLEMGDTPFSMDGGTGGLAFDVTNNGVNDVTMPSAGALTLGTATVNAGTFTMMDGDETGDDTATMALSHDGAGDFSITTDDGHITLAANDNIYLTPTGGDVILGGALVTSTEAVTTTAGGIAASLVTYGTVMTTEVGGVAATAISLADGTAGQIRVFTMAAETDAGDTIVLTPATPLGFANLTFDAIGDACTLYFDGTSWNIIGNNNCT